MELPQQDGLMMQRALELARGAVGVASPNPTVGCVLVRDDEVIGEGAHRYDAFDHAEIVALKQAAARGEEARGATAYVTLEPCSFHGRTGPCAEALVRAGIARCVVATVDPNPKVSGAGIATMRAAGVAVDVAEAASLLALEARRLNDAFAFAIRHGRPFVTLKAALSVDGMLAPADRHRENVAPVWLTGEAARADVHRLRHESDAILTGSGTVRMDDPSLTDRSGLTRRRPLLRVVLDSAMTTRPEAAMLRAGTREVVFFVTEAAEAARCEAVRATGAEVVVAETADGGVDLGFVMRWLQERQIRSLLVEGGAGINEGFLKAGLVDRVVLYFSETELGRDAVPFARGGASPYVLLERLGSVTREVFAHGVSADVRVSGYVRDPWIGV